MSNKIVVKKWEYEATDWVVSIDIIYEKYIFVGCRDGSLHVLNWFGTIIHQEQFNSWLGALRVFIVSESDIEGYEKPLIFIGTKEGEFCCFRILSFLPFSWVEVFKYKAGNTIRRIDILHSPSGIADTYIAIGSEDKHVYIFNLGEMISGKQGIRVIQTKPNGWVRAIAFCISPVGTRLIAAGCGDKYLHLYELNGKEIDAVCVDSKIHSIISDQISAEIYCTSDAKKMYIISPKEENTYYIRKEISLPERGNFICHVRNDKTKLLISGEMGGLYLFDLNKEELIGEYHLEEPVYSIFDISEISAYGYSTLIGLGSRTLACLNYSVGNECLAVDYCSSEARIESIGQLSCDQNIAMHAYGHMQSKERIGIGRFISTVITDENTFLFVGTDEGGVFILRANQGNLVLLGSHFLKDKRVWSVSAYQLAGVNCFRAYVGTSDKYVALIDVRVDLDNSHVKFELIETIQVGEWPREVRPVLNGKSGEVVIACESGNVIIYPGNTDLCKGKEVYRSVFCIRSNNNLELVTGSDNNLVSYYSNHELQWQYIAGDRIRETLIKDEYVIAVSEDRYMYVIMKSGEIASRYCFPHRALCVDLLIEQETYCFVVGCGDGFVYFVAKSGEILHAFKFPDRVRDVVSLNSSTLFVACESLYLYSLTLPPILSKRIDTPTEQCNDIVKKLLEQGSSFSILRTSVLSVEEKLYLLEFSNYWWNRARTDLLIYLIDSAEKEVYFSQNLKHYYIYANALIFLAARVEMAVGVSRIQEYLIKNGSIYGHHSMLIALSKYRSKSTEKIANKNIVLIIDLVFSLIDISNDWILEEAVRVLGVFGFFSFNEAGLTTYFNKIQLPTKRFDKLFSLAKHRYCCKEPVVDFLHQLDEVTCGYSLISSIEFANRINKIEGCQSFSSILVLLLNSIEHDCLHEFFLGCTEWCKSEINNSTFNKITQSLLEGDMSMQGNSKHFVSLARTVFELTLRQENVTICAKDYVLQRVFSTIIELIGHAALSPSNVIKR